MRNTKKPIQLYRGTTQQHSDYAGPVGEITVDTEKYTVVVQNGVTGGVPLAREDTVVSLTNRIAAEESARATADTAIQKQIDNSLRRGAVIGEIRWFAMSTPPEGWLPCNGAAVYTSNYVALFAAIGKTFTPRYLDESLKIEDPRYSDPDIFLLPNLMGKVPWGSTSVGTVLDAGLPNIKGAVNNALQTFSWSSSISAGSGAITTTPVGDTMAGTHGNGYGGV